MKEKKHSWASSSTRPVPRPAQADFKISMTHHVGGDKQNSGGKVFTKIADGGKIKNNGVWNVLHCVRSSDLDDSRAISVSYSSRNNRPKETFSLGEKITVAVGRANSIRSIGSSSNDVSNSSLRDVDRGALEDELSAYMEELRQREVG